MPSTATGGNDVRMWSSNTSLVERHLRNPSMPRNRSIGTDACRASQALDQLGAMRTAFEDHPNIQCRTARPSRTEERKRNTSATSHPSATTARPVGVSLYGVLSLQPSVLWIAPSSAVCPPPSGLSPLRSASPNLASAATICCTPGSSQI